MVVILIFFAFLFHFQMHIALDFLARGLYNFVKDAEDAFEPLFEEIFPNDTQVYFDRFMEGVDVFYCE